MISGSKLARTVRLYLAGIDIPLLFYVLALSVIGIINMYGVGGNDYSLVKKQIVLIGMGFVVMTLFSFFNYRYLKNNSLPVLLLYIFSLFLLVLTFYSHSVRGTQSWLVLGGFTFEPAELIKLCLIIIMAKYFSQRHVHIYQFRHIIISGLYFAIPAVLMISQPDLGSAIILTLIWASLLLTVGINRKHLAILILIGVFISYGGWMLALKPYQKARIVSFLDQSVDPRGSGYNLIQSKIAIGSGFWFGNGLGKGSQTSLGFLPEPHNDFIFAALSEQFGFVGGIIALGLSLLLVYRTITVGLTTTSNFGKLFSVGLAVFIFAHVFVSAGVNIGLLPVTGLPFPFLSSGGSNLILIMAGIGIIQSIKRYG